MARGSIGRKDVSNFLSDLFEGDVHAKRVQSMANATVGVLTSASLGVHAIGQGLAHACDLMPKHAVKQVDRLLSNQGIEVWDYFAYWVPYVVGSRTTIVVALDWTMFEGDQATITLSMLTDHGRSTPLLWKTVRSATLKGTQTMHEDALLVRLKEVVPADVSVSVVADRGIADCKLFEFLESELNR